MTLTPEQRRANTLEFLKDVCVMHLATTEGTAPLASVMLYAVDDAFHFYFVSFRSAKKVAHIAKNPKVSLAVWEHNTALVEVEGNAYPMPPDEKRDKVAHMLAEIATRESRFWPPIFRIDESEHVIFEIVPEHVRVLDITAKSMTHQTLPFEEVAL